MDGRLDFKEVLDDLFQVGCCDGYWRLKFHQGMQGMQYSLSTVLNGIGAIVFVLVRFQVLLWLVLSIANVRDYVMIT